MATIVPFDVAKILEEGPIEVHNKKAEEAKRKAEEARKKAEEEKRNSISKDLNCADSVRNLSENSSNIPRQPDSPCYPSATQPSEKTEDPVSNSNLNEEKDGNEVGGSMPPP